MAMATRAGRLTASSHMLLIAQAPIFTVRTSCVARNTANAAQSIHEHTQIAVGNPRITCVDHINDRNIENVAHIVHGDTGKSQNIVTYSKIREDMELFRARERPLMWKTNVGSTGNLPGFRKRFLGGALDRTGFVSSKGSRCITRPVDWTRVPYMTFPKRERRRKYRIKSLEEKESDRGWHPELCTYESEFQKMHALYFYNLLAFPWEKGAFERFVDKLERKYFPDEHIDALVPPKDKVLVKSQGRSKQNKNDNTAKSQERVSSLQEVRTIAGDQTPSIQTADIDETTEERRPGYVEYSADDWQPVSDTSEYTESVSKDVPVRKSTSTLAPKPPIIKRGMALPENWDGPLGTIVLIDKPVGWTSFTVCGKLRKLLKIQKVGHAGTLDPMATGLLVVCVGKATKFADSYQAMRKVYSGTMRLGEATASYDADTMVSERLPWEHVTDEDVQLIKQEFVGTIRQVPPLYSALKVEGEKLYEKARRGETFQVPPRLISIDELHLERDSENRQDFHFKVVCSKGTYIRSLCYDIGRALNTCAHLVALRRDQIGDMSVEDAWQFSELGKHYADDFLGKACSKTSSIPHDMSLEDAWEFPELQDNVE